MNHESALHKLRASRTNGASNIEKTPAVSWTTLERRRGGVHVRSTTSLLRRRALVSCCDARMPAQPRCFSSPKRADRGRHAVGLRRESFIALCAPAQQEIPSMERARQKENHMSLDPLAVRVPRRHAAVVPVPAEIVRIQYSDSGRISAQNLTRMLEPEVGVLVKLRFRAARCGRSLA